MRPSTHVRVLRYLSVAGVVVPWDVVFYVSIAAIGAYSASLQSQADNAALAMLVLAPILVGTGVISIAREGRLDLLFGSGASRAQVWAVVLARAVVVPLLVIAACAAWFVRSGGTTAAEAFGRAVLVGAFTMGIAFAVGSVQPRFVLGVVWCAARLVFLLSSRGRGIYMQIVHPAEAGHPTFAHSVIGLFGFPEVLLYAHVTAGAVVLVMCVSCAALVTSYLAFLKADFGGHRTA